MTTRLQLLTLCFVAWLFYSLLHRVFIRFFFFLFCISSTFSSPLACSRTELLSTHFFLFVLSLILCSLLAVIPVLSTTLKLVLSFYRCRARMRQWTIKLCKQTKPQCSSYIGILPSVVWLLFTSHFASVNEFIESLNAFTHVSFHIHQHCRFELGRPDWRDRPRYFAAERIYARLRHIIPHDLQSECCVLKRRRLV